jgi:dsRNA-specific ribonuclease
LKIFGDVLEALFAAIFIDSGCDLDKTREVFLKLFEPYLYVYGNTLTTGEHPRT